MNPNCAPSWESANAVEAAGWLGHHLVRTRDHGAIPTRGNQSLDTPLFWTLMGPAALEVRPAMLFRCTGNCVDGLLVYSAHGPPFLTVTGILLVYVPPSALLAWWALRKLLAQTPSSSTGHVGEE